MIYDISSLSDAVNQVDDTTYLVSVSLDSNEWEDEVGESYQRYISHCIATLEDIQKTVATLESTCNDLESIDVDYLIDSAESICSQIEGF